MDHIIFVCPNCSLNLLNNQELNNHLQASPICGPQPPQNPYFKCYVPLCPLKQHKFLSQPAVIQHFQQTHTKVACPDCHLLLAVGQPNRHPCNPNRCSTYCTTCKEAFQHSWQYDWHMQAHKYKCQAPLCEGKAFNYNKNLKHHMQAYHSVVAKDKRHVCPSHLFADFPTHADVVMHQMEHRGEWPCPHCTHSGDHRSIMSHLQSRHGLKNSKRQAALRQYVNDELDKAAGVPDAPSSGVPATELQQRPTGPGNQQPLPGFGAQLAPPVIPGAPYLQGSGAEVVQAHDDYGPAYALGPSTISAFESSIVQDQTSTYPLRDADTAQQSMLSLLLDADPPQDVSATQRPTLTNVTLVQDQGSGVAHNQHATYYSQALDQFGQPYQAQASVGHPYSVTGAQHIVYPTEFTTSYQPPAADTSGLSGIPRADTLRRQDSRVRQHPTSYAPYSGRPARVTSTTPGVVTVPVTSSGAAPAVSQFTACPPPPPFPQ